MLYSGKSMRSGENSKVSIVEVVVVQVVEQMDSLVRKQPKEMCFWTLSLKRERRETPAALMLARAKPPPC